MSNKGKRVRVHYVGKLDDGSTFDSSLERGEPLAFTCGVGQVVPGFDETVEAMAVNETKSIHIPAAEAYGEYDYMLIERVPLEEIPNADALPVGKTVYMNGPNGQFPVKVLEKTSEFAVFDMNHHLAGQALNFEITLVEVMG